VRFFPDRDPDKLEALANRVVERERVWRASAGQTGPLPPVDYLVISGGGGDGAFGAGILTGWSENGDRPDFKLITGISTGALIAPFAFAGKKYDSELKLAYTNTTEADIFKKRSFLAALFDDALTTTKPMAKLVDGYVTPQLLTDVAAEYDKGRVLLVGTTNLDAREPVYWDMGALAKNGSPEAARLFRQITLASAAIPGMFPPVMIDVTVDGKPHQEMHVDGGATRQAFMYPPQLRLRELSQEQGIERKRSVYIMRNSRLDPDWASVDRRTLSIVGRAVSSLIQTQGMGDLIRMYLTASRDHVDFNLAYIPSDFTMERTSEFDPKYMEALFERGREMALKGYPWSKTPPGYEANDGAVIGR
jgi:predicted acylesterase/phospholipase RssA